MMAKGWVEVVVGWPFGVAKLSVGGCWKWVVVGDGAELGG